MQKKVKKQCYYKKEHTWYNNKTTKSYNVCKS